MNEWNGTREAMILGSDGRIKGRVLKLLITQQRGQEIDI